MRMKVAAGTVALGFVLALCGCAPATTVEVMSLEESTVATPPLAQTSLSDEVVTPATPENATVIAEYAATEGPLPRTSTREFVGTMGADLTCRGGTPLRFGILAGSSAEVPCDGKTYRIVHDSNLSVAAGGLEVTAPSDTRWAAVVWLLPEG
ncbi:MULTISPECIES: hypothetical protein [Microbacterium]|uniref:hypothetical protein n=1 Tax=Microbacterium TaxID=33882 RepID=UPI001E3E0279|nr:hypothetical protein [Microbacterium nymphoidis]MCD2497601.1 hypothetical protein [Microbacterium nymphoidis]